MLKRGDSKGLSKFATIFLIMMIVLIVIVFFVVRDVILKGSGERALGKYTLDLEISKVQVVNNNNSLMVVVKRNMGDGNFTGINFVVEDTINKETISTNVSLEELESRTFVLPLGIIDISKIKKLSIYPVLGSGLTEKVGEMEDEYLFGSSNLEVCTPYCPPEYECGDDGCGGECRGGCTEQGYFCSENKCFRTLEEKCLETNLLVTRVENATKGVMDGNFSITLSREGEVEMGGVIFAFMDENESSNVVIDIPGDVPSLVSVNMYVLVLDTHLENPKKVRFMAYFFNNSGKKEVCKPSSPFSF